MSSNNTTQQTERQLSSISAISRSTLNRDERHPVTVDQASSISIDNNTLNSIINSIIPPSNQTDTNNEMKSTQTSPNNNGSNDIAQHFLLPVDLLVSVDKSNKPTVQAALPSTFALQPPTAFSLPFAFPPPPPPPMPSIPTFTNPDLPQLPSIPMNIFMSQPQQQQQQQLQQAMPIKQESKLNRLAPPFIPSTNYSPFGQIFNATTPISEQQAVFNNTNTNNQTPNDKEQIKETEEHDDNSWWKIDEEQQEEGGGGNTGFEDVRSTTTAWTGFKSEKRRYFHHEGSDHRQYHRNWRNQNNKPDVYGNNKLKVTKPTKLLVEFVKHVTLPNRANYPANTVLTKTWAMKNVGKHAWGYGVELVYCKGDENLSLYKRYPVSNAKSGEIVQISATIKTPIQAGRYCTYFRLQKFGRFFGPRVWVDVIVDNDPLNERTKMHHCGKDVVRQQQNEKILTSKAMKWKKKQNHYQVACK